MYGNGTTAANHARKRHRLQWDSPPGMFVVKKNRPIIEVFTNFSGVLEGWWVGLADLLKSLV